MQSTQRRKGRNLGESSLATRHAAVANYSQSAHRGTKGPEGTTTVTRLFVSENNFSGRWIFSAYVFKTSVCQACASFTSLQGGLREFRLKRHLKTKKPRASKIGVLLMWTVFAGRNNPYEK